jgi:hypothetical protein
LVGRFFPVYSGSGCKGVTYKKDIVDDLIEHKCDCSKLPAGTVILKVMKRQNLPIWVDKGTVQLNKLIPALKGIALELGSNVHVDETWCRYRTCFEYKKIYM